MGPVNGIIGDDGGQITGVIPSADIDDSQLKELQEMARFAKSKQYKELKERFESRIAFYKQYLPDGRAVGAQMPTPEMGYMWLAANVINGELTVLLNAYDSAASMLEEYTQRNAAA